MAIKYWVWFAVALVWAVGIGFHLANKRAARRGELWEARYRHKKSLQKAANAGETSLEFHAMQCTACGNFHPEDDSECPLLLAGQG